MYARKKPAVLFLSCLLVLAWGTLIGQPTKASAYDLQTPVGSAGGLPSLAPFAGTSPEALAAAVDCKRTYKASRYLPSGTLDQLMKYVYNKTGQLTKTNSFDGTDTSQLESYVTYKYNTEGQLTKVSVYDASKVLLYYGVSQYNAQGQITKGSAYGPGDNLLYYGTCTYNAQGRLTKITLYESDDSLKYVGKLTYNKKGQMTKLSIYDDAAATANDLVAYLTFTYNSTTGLMTKETVYVIVPFFGAIKYYYVNFAYQTGTCAPGNTDPLFIWGMLATFSELAP